MNSKSFSNPDSFSLTTIADVECFEKIDSTNNYAKKILSECGNLRDENGNLTDAGQKYHNSVIVAECQTAGRGRLGREFVSPKKTGIYLSVIYAPENGIQEPAKLTAFSAVAVCRTLKKLFNLDAQIKWVNDVFLNGKKVSGILTEGIVNFETRKIEAAIVGIGLNIFENNDFSQGFIDTLEEWTDEIKTLFGKEIKAKPTSKPVDSINEGPNKKGFMEGEDNETND